MKKVLGALAFVVMAAGCAGSNSNTQGAGIISSESFEEQLKDAALHVVTDQGRGSAVVIDGRGLALSAAHVCELFQKAKMVKVIDSHRNEMAIEFYEVAPKSKVTVDLCIFKFTPKMHHPATRLADGNALVLGTLLFNPNYGGGEFYSLRTGYVVAEETVRVPTGDEACFPPFVPCTQFNLYNIKRTSVPGIPGASGSGIFNSKFEVVGVLVIGGNGGEWSGIVPLQTIKGYLSNESKLFRLSGIAL